MDDKMTNFGDLALPNPSPRTLMSSFLNEEFGSKSFSYIFAENRSNWSLTKFEKPEMPGNSKEEAVEVGFNFSNDISLESKLFDVRKSSSRGCLAQRIDRAGFNAPTVDTDRIKSGNIAFSQSEIRSPYLTIPPGLSPTTLLDSLVFLSNSMPQLSPTTGKISFKINDTNSLSISASVAAVPDESKDDHLEDDAPAGFSFEPPLNMSLLSLSSSFQCQEVKGPAAIDHPQSLQDMKALFQKGPSDSDRLESLQDMEASFQKDFNFPACFLESSDRIDNENSTPLDALPNQEGTHGELSSITVATLAEDGYTWRKYGQKLVKASAYPRSYYKCAQPNCQVEKMIECSHESHITEMIYRGAQHIGSHANFVATLPSFGDPLASVQTEDVPRFGSPEAMNVSSSVSNDEDEEDRATHGSISLGGEGEGDESESKRRKLDACAVEMSRVSRAIREPRVVIQTTCDVDILDDGYLWRNYGQKVVKGNPNPRSYYKCTYPGCTVRKQVERASHDLKSVITTYAGRHNHRVPAAINNSQPKEELLGSGCGLPISNGMAAAYHQLMSRLSLGPQL